MSDLIHGQFHKHGLLYALHCKTINEQQKEKANQPGHDASEVIKENEKKKCITPLLKETLTAQPRQTPRLSLAQVKKAAAYPSAAAARSSLRRPSVTSAPEISQTEPQQESPTADVPPVLIRL